MQDNCLFTETDYEILRSQMKDLSPRDFKILFLRFWGKQSLSEIANDMRLSFEEVDSSIKSSLKLLKNLCLKDSLFSRFPDNFLKVANQ